MLEVTAHGALLLLRPRWQDGTFVRSRATIPRRSLGSSAGEREIKIDLHLCGRVPRHRVFRRSNFSAGGHSYAPVCFSFLGGSADTMGVCDMWFLTYVMKFIAL